MKRAYTDEHAQSGVNAKLPEIETWPNQYAGYEIEIVDARVHLGLPQDRAARFRQALVLRYVPDKHCLELKSYKMYLLEYRNAWYLPGEHCEPHTPGCGEAAAKPVQAQLRDRRFRVTRRPDHCGNRYPTAGTRRTETWKTLS